MSEDIGHIDRARLASVLPKDVPIRKGGKGRLYIVSPFGAWFFGPGGAGQDFLLEHGVFYGPEGKPAEPEPVVAAPVSPEEPALVEPNDAAGNDTEEAEESGGFFDFLKLDV